MLDVEKESKPKVMEINMKEIGKMMLEVEKDFFIEMMVVNMMENGKMIK